MKLGDKVRRWWKPAEKIGFADNHEVASRRAAINRFLDHVLDADDPTWWFMADETTLVDIGQIANKDEGLLTSRIREAYGVDLAPEQLSQPIWRLVDSLEGRP